MTTHDGPPFIPEPPTGPAYALRAGLRCAAAPMDHPAVIVTARTWRALDHLERGFHCAVCQAPAFGVFRPSPRRPAPAQPVRRPDGSPVER